MVHRDRLFTRPLSLLMFALCTLSVAALLGSRMPEAQATPGARRVPLRFEPNLGQAEAGIQYLARTGGCVLLLDGDGATLTSGGSKLLRMEFLGVSSAQKWEGAGTAKGIARYYVGRDPEAWQPNVPLFPAVRASEVYPGIDLVYYAGEAGEGTVSLLEYDLVVRPGADPTRIKLELETPGEVTLERDGGLLVRSSGQAVRLRKPVIYQEVLGKRRAVAGGYRMAEQVSPSSARLAFAIGEYDPTLTLVIDPTLDYSTYLGGTNGSNANGNDDGNGIAVDPAGRAHVVGRAQSVNFPTRNAADGSLNNGPSTNHERDGFVTQMTADGSDIEFSTFIGGSKLDVCFSISLDAAGNVYAAGRTASMDFPTTPGALRTTDPDNSAQLDGILVKLSPTGALLYSTYVGGTSYDICHGIGAVNELDGSGNYLGSHVLVTGETRSQDFPVKNALQATYGGGAIDCFVLSLDADRNDATTGIGDLAYSTYLGGSGDDSGYGLCVDGQGRALIAGITASPNFPTTHNALDTTRGGSTDAFVARVDPALAGVGSLNYSSYLGGSGDEIGYGIGLDPEQNVYSVGETTSVNFPTASAFDSVISGASDAFVVKLNPSLSPATQLRYGTYIGGSSADAARQVAVSPGGAVAVCGGTASSNFPLVGALQGNQSGNDGWVAQLNPAGNALSFSSYLGGSGLDEARGIAADSDGDLYLTGETASSNFPTTPGAFDQTLGSVGDCWIAKITFTSVPSPPPAGNLQFRSASTGGNENGANSLVMARPSGVVAGDLLLAAVTTASTSVAYAAPAGWSQVINASENSTIRAIVYRRVAGASEPASYTWAFNATVRAVGAIAAYSGADPAQPIAAADGYGNSVSQSITAPGVTAPTPGSMLIQVASTAAATGIAPANGMTKCAEAVGIGLTVSVNDQVLSSAGATGNRTAVAGQAARNVGHSIVLRPAP